MKVHLLKGDGMQHSTLEELLTRRTRPVAATAPIAVVFNEDGVKIIETLNYLTNLGFSEILMVSAVECDLPEELDETVHFVTLLFRDNTQTAAILNRVIEAYAGRWIFWCYNAEFLFFPHCETRSIADVSTFMEEERRSSTFTQVVDVFSDDIARDGHAVCLENTFFDISGYYGLPRYDGPEMLEDQFDLLGGLKWRFEEHIPYSQRFIDRVSFFRSGKGLEIGERGVFNDPDYNTVSCPWHNNLTIAIASFRTAKALLHNPGSRSEIQSFLAPQSRRFEWKSQQLLELGFMESGQWF